MKPGGQVAPVAVVAKEQDRECHHQVTAGFAHGTREPSDDNPHRRGQLLLTIDDNTECSAKGNYFGCVIGECPPLRVHLHMKVGVYKRMFGAAPEKRYGRGGGRGSPHWFHSKPVHRLTFASTLGFGRDNMGWNGGRGSGGGRRPPTGGSGRGKSR